MPPCYAIQTLAIPDRVQILKTGTFESVMGQKSV